MPSVQELREQRETLFKQAEALDAKGEAVTAEDTATIDGLLNQCRDLDAQIADVETRAQAAESRRATLDAMRSVAHPGRKTSPDAPSLSDIKVGKDRVSLDPKRGFSNIADFAAELMSCGPSLGAIQANPRLRAAAGTGMVQGITNDGGVLVPPAFSSTIWDGARQMSESMLGYCDTQTIDPGVQSLEVPGINETSRANGSRWGGIQGYWKSELAAMTETKPKMRSIKIEPQEVYVFAYISDKLLRNAPGVASGILTRAAADEINFKIGDSVFNGDGVGKPRGIIGHGSVVSVAKESGQAAATVVKQNIDKMWSRCHANWRGNAVWFINQDVEPALQEMTIGVGTGGAPVYMPPGGLSGAPYATLKGRPVIPVEYCATLGTVGDIVLADLKSYFMGIRGMVDQAQSMHLKFDYAQTAFRFIFEADGQPYLASAITPFKGTNTTSPIVTLATRS